MFVFLFAGSAGADELDFPSESADDYSVNDLHHLACLQNDMVRLISIEYSGPDGQPPCSVVYEKSSPERPSREILWHAEHSTIYCELRVREFVEMLRSWNWKCGLFRDVFASSEEDTSQQPRSVRQLEDPSDPAQDPVQ